MELNTFFLNLFTNTSSRAGYDTRSIFKRSLTGLNSEFSFSLTSCLTPAEEHSLPYYLPIAGGRRIGFIPFPRVLVQCEMQSVSSRIWTRVAVFISYDDNHYTTYTSTIPPCLTLIIIRYVSIVKWINPGKSVAASLTSRYDSYWKESNRLTHDYSRQLYSSTSVNSEFSFS